MQVCKSGPALLPIHHRAHALCSIFKTVAAHRYHVIAVVMFLCVFAHQIFGEQAAEGDGGDERQPFHFVGADLLRGADIRRREHGFVELAAGQQQGKQQGGGDLRYSHREMLSFLGVCFGNSIIGLKNSTGM